MEMASRGVIRHRGQILKLLVTILVVLAVLMAHWGAGAAVMLGLLAASATTLVDGRFSFGIALLCLASWPLLGLADRQGWLQLSPLVNYYVANAGLYTLKSAPDTVAMWAFYFLCIGLTGRTIQYVLRDKRYDSA